MTSVHSGERVLAGDIGGTKTNLGLFEVAGTDLSLLVMETYPSGDAESLEDLVARFQNDHPETVSAACFGIAGPVRQGECRATNLPWIVSEREVKKRFTWERVRLINDLAATAYAIPLLSKSDLHDLHRGRPDPNGNIGLAAPGTGLGMALIVTRDGNLHPLASEGGHVDFAPRNDKEIDLLRYLLQDFGHVSVERLASGPGLFTIYSWLRKYRTHQEPPWLTERINQEDPPQAISEAALNEKEPICVEALDMFVSILGAAAGNLALTGFTTGGMFLGGGISPRILPKLQEGGFLDAFTAKGRFRDLMSDIPVRVILNDKAALLGAASCALGIARHPH